MKGQEIMAFLHERVFNQVLNSTTAPDWMKRGVNKTIKRMENMSALEMIQYYWKAISSQKGARFSDSMNKAGFIRFEDIKDEFANRFNDEWAGRWQATEKPDTFRTNRPVVGGQQKN